MLNLLISSFSYVSIFWDLKNVFKHYIELLENITESETFKVILCINNIIVIILYFAGRQLYRLFLLAWWTKWPYWRNLLCKELQRDPSTCEQPLGTEDELVDSYKNPGPSGLQLKKWILPTIWVNLKWILPQFNLQMSRWSSQHLDDSRVRSWPEGPVMLWPDSWPTKIVG